MARTVSCTPATRKGRRAKAEQFLESADTIRALAHEASDVADSVVTLLVHAGVAAADVICCVRLGEHAQGENHAEAVQLLARAAEKKIANDLATLLSIKSKAAYSAGAVSADDLARAQRAADRLVEAMRQVG